LARPKNKRRFNERPYRALASGVLLRALQDARLGDCEAADWLQSSAWAGYLLDVLSIPPERIARLVDGMEVQAV